MTELFRAFLNWLQTHMCLKYDYERENFLTDIPVDVKKVYWVHELCQCPEKTRFEEGLPELAKTVWFKPAVMLGELIHIAMEQYGGGAVTRIYSKTLQVDGEKVMVAGTPDFVSKEFDTVVDFKYSARVGKDVLEHHELQVALYKWLTGAKHGEVWYFTHDAFKAFPVKMEADDSMVEDLIKDTSCPRWPDWECGYCEFKQLCRHSS